MEPPLAKTELKPVSDQDPPKPQPIKTDKEGGHDNPQAALWMCAAGSCFAAVIIIVRFLSETQHPLEIAFFRNLFGLLAMVPFLYRHGVGVLRTEQFPLHIVRATIALAAMLSWFTALGIMPLAEATSLSFTAPIFMSVLAIWFFGEKIRLRRWSAIIIAFAGVLIILRPGIGVIEPASLLAVFSAIMIASSSMVVKKLGQTESSPVIVTYMVLLLTPVTFIGALFVWQTPNLIELVAFAALGGIGSIGHFCVVQALSKGEASFIAPFDYLRLPIVALFAWLLFNETVDTATWIGAGIIIASSIYIARREAQLKSAQKDQPG